jgi:hypothetical protein
VRTIRRSRALIVVIACWLLGLAALAVPAGAAGWQPLSQGDLPDPTRTSSLLVGGKVVVAWRTTADAIVATTFSSTPQVSVSGATSVPIVDVAGSDPVLLSARGSGVSAVFATAHSQDRSDPLNGLAFFSRSSDGSWSSSRVVPTGVTTTCGIAGLLLSDGSPLFATNFDFCTGGVGVVHGSNTLDDADMIQYRPEDEALNLALARDGRGHVWVAWYSHFQGVVMRQLDGTGTPIGHQFVAPDSIPPDSIWEASDVDRFALVCNPAAAGCHVVYKARLGSRIVSWTPHDGAPQILVAADAGISLGAFAAAYRGDGRLWLAWIANPNFNRQSLRFALAGPAGRFAAVSLVPTPHGSVPTHLSLQPIGGGLLVLAGVPTTRSAEPGASPLQLWADHVTKR